MAIITAVFLLGRAADRAQIEQHTKAQVIDRMREEFGDAGLTLYGAIGDALDQKSGWLKTMDIIFWVFDEKPWLMLDYMVECYGVDAVLEALTQYEEAN